MKEVFQQTAKQTLLQCTECKTIFPIFRKKGREQKRGHIKHVYCYKCKIETEHVEIKDEFHLH